MNWELKTALLRAAMPDQCVGPSSFLGVGQAVLGSGGIVDRGTPVGVDAYTEML